MYVNLVSVFSTAEAVLQEMDNISSIRQNREVERLRMWTDTELVTPSVTLIKRQNNLAAFFHLIKQTIAHIEIIKILHYSEVLAFLFSVGCEPTDESKLAYCKLHCFIDSSPRFMFRCLFIYFFASGKHGHVLPCEEEEVFAEEHIWNAGASQSHEQIKGPRRGGRN